MQNNLGTMNTDTGFNLFATNNNSLWPNLCEVYIFFLFRNAGVYTVEEVVTRTKERLIRLQSQYVEQFSRLNHCLREQRRMYLHSVKKEKELPGKGAYTFSFLYLNVFGGVISSKFWKVGANFPKSSENNRE